MNTTMTDKFELPALSRLAMGSPSKEIKQFKTWVPSGLTVRLGLVLRRLLLTLADRIVPVSLPLFERSTGLMDTVILSIVSKHEIADHLEQRPQTAADLARITGTDADAMHRILRAAASRGVFQLDQDGLFHNNRLSKALLKGNATANREWSQYFGSQSNMLAWMNLPRAVVEGQPSFDHVFGMNVWEWFEHHNDEQEMFAHSMMGVTALQAPVIARLYPFAEVKSICDVGGGRGTLMSELLTRHQHLKGILFDAAGVLKSAEELLKARGVAERVEKVEGSFLISIPNADAYLFKNIFHDWNDEFCSSILQTLKKSIKAGQKVLIIEQLVEKNSIQGIGPASDVQMMVACSGGRERSLAEIQGLLMTNGFQVGRTFLHPLISVVEGTFH
ncbi:MAG: hypothetical protein H7249_12875 [Chitinophagaceae bacterium]|nr:hypothetical protein [Oligoflexus sp.]